jgi:hypothetical protein
VAVVAVLALALALSGLPGSGGGSRAAAQSGGEVIPQSDGSVPARKVVMFGSSPRESPGETWGVGEVGHEQWGIVHYGEGAGWTRVQWLGANGAPPAEGFLKMPKSPLSGEVTPSGAAALLGTAAAEPQATGHKVLLVRNPGGAFQETEAVPSALLKPGESLFERERAPLLAALDEGGGRAGALVVPVNSGSSGVMEDGVLHWDAGKWTREQIEVPEASKGDFRVLAVSAPTAENAWLLGQLAESIKPGAVALFRRVPGSGGAPATWRQQGTAGEPLSVPALGEQFTVTGTGEPPLVTAPLLTATKQGLWLDGETHQGRLTMFFDLSKAKWTGVWCFFSATGCKSLPDQLPAGPSRSVAWENSGLPYGERVITGLNEGVTLRLEGESFARVLALGGGADNVGSGFGAAFSDPHEGWLGGANLPVHLVPPGHAPPNQLTRYPVPFHHALLAVAPQPGAAPGTLASQALAVGNDGEVARYTPGEGWQPESLLNAAGRRATPRLRAVAWPTPTRAFAVGDLGQMWLWRGETGLWEPDPAVPRNFRGNLLGVAFDPGDPSHGYAVGQQGVLLRYGKSWSEEAPEAIPAEARGASFTSVAFAAPGEALVAFRKPETNKGIDTYTGGLLVNNGSGWSVVQAATAPLGPGGLPWAVAGLPDGGAALSGEDIYGTPIVVERNDATSSWQPGPPYPGNAAPGSLALFREGGALRAVGAGSIVSTFQADFGEVPPPPGFPPNLVRPYPAANGYVMRQSALGWSDEQHDLTEARPTAGEWANYDLPRRPDPSAAVLVDPSGSQGWAVGGEIDPNPAGRLDTAEAARYHEPGAAPPGFVPSPVQAGSSPKTPTLTFAIGGGAQCAAPCADRANADVGPDVWLKTAIAGAAQIELATKTRAVNAFIYLGPRVTSGEHLTGNNPLKPPYEREFARYAELLSNPQLPTLVVPSASDRTGAEGECKFQGAFPAFPFKKELCATEGGSYYETSYAATGAEVSEAEGAVHVIVLDDSNGVDPGQLKWLGERLEFAAKQGPLGTAAIVVGNGDLEAEAGAGTLSASEAIKTIVGQKASAYFYDSPQQNIRSQLRVPGVGSIPAYGSGTLGYANAIQSERQDYVGHSGYLLAEVPLSRVTPVPTPRLIPNIGELALEAKDGVLLRRSQSALFAALARRPTAGCVTNGTRNECESSQYIPIPANCVGAACASAILPEYEFSSVREKEIGEFVAPNVASSDPHAVLLGSNGKPIEDNQSGLFCALNAGTTSATIRAGGYSASLTITIQAGSVRRPCGTAPINEVASQQQSGAPAPPAPAPAPAPAGAAPSGTPPPLPVPAPPAAAPPARAVPPPPTFLPLPAVTASILPFVPLPVPTPARPTPPSGTSPVTSPIEVAEHEEEQEEAPESVSNQAVAYRSSEHEPSSAYILGVVLLAAFAGASIRRPRRSRREVKVAPATISTQRRARRDGSRVTRW